MSDPHELYSLLIPLRDERLLVPRICVAEVIALAESPDLGSDDVPDWYAGTVAWNGRRLPVIMLDRSPGELESKRNRRRIVVFHGITPYLKGRFYGVLTQGFPQLVRVNPDVLAADPDFEPEPQRPILCRARMIHEYPLIPDLERIEEMVAALSSTTLA
jgi:chemosensory pili system protein ChpC